MNLRAKLVAIEGIDQAGKKTQTRLLAKHLQERGFRVSTVSFPVYTSSTGRSIGAYLSGNKFYPFRALCMLYSLNRWEHFQLLNKLLDESDFLIANRYTPSGLAYGMAGGLERRWLESLDKGIPKPSMVLVLDIPVKTSSMRKRRARDLHERNARYLVMVRKMYHSLARKLDWKILSADDSAIEVHRRVRERISQ